MKRSFYRLFAVIFCLFLLFSVVMIPPVRATETEEATEATDIVKAVDISGTSIVTKYTGYKSIHFLFDKNDTACRYSQSDTSLIMEHEDGIGSLYLVFYDRYPAYTVIDNTTGAEYTKEAPLLHDFIDVEAVFGTAPTSITLTFPESKVSVSELYVFTPGQVPNFVQQWEVPGEGETDLVLFSTHGDDEHLFFAGILPYYAKELGYQVQVVYLTDHTNMYGPGRMREMLDGLWAVGVTTYPIFGEYPDFRIDDKELTYSRFEQYGYSRESFVEFVTENIRRFKPKVVIGHDFAGEYGHGQHQVYAEALALALELTMDPAQFPESAEKYGVWDVPKAYFHLYGENQIVMDWDQPLESFGGMTPYEVSIQIGFEQNHKSQIRYYSWYYAYAPTAASVVRYDPCHYGLYRSTVGPDVEKNDFFENTTTYAEDVVIEAQRLAEEEAARIAAEEAERAAEKEAARLAAEEADQLIAESVAEKAKAKEQTMYLLWGGALLLVILAIPLTHFRSRK